MATKKTDMNESINDSSNRIGKSSASNARLSVMNQQAGLTLKSKTGNAKDIINAQTINYNIVCDLERLEKFKRVVLDIS